MVWGLSQLTVSRIIGSGRRKGTAYSNWNSVSRGVFANIRSDIARKGIFAGI
jgi:hypothetical protein